MSARRFYYTTDGSDVNGPVTSDWLWENVNSLQLDPAISVCEDGTEDWLPFTSLPDSVFSARILTQSSKQTQNTIEAEQLHLQAQHRLIECQSHMEVYGHRTDKVTQSAQDGIEFIDAALKLAPNNPIYLNTKGLLLSDGLGQKDLGMSFLNMAADRAPKNIQIQQNIRNLTQRSEGCLVVLGIGASLFGGVCYEVFRVCIN